MDAARMVPVVERIVPIPDEPGSRSINRPYTWIAHDDGGNAYQEIDYGGIGRLTGVRITALQAVCQANPDDPNRQFVVQIPSGSRPIALTTTAIVIDPNTGKQQHFPVLGIGYEEGEGDPIGTVDWESPFHRTLLWVLWDGSAIVSHTQLDFSYLQFAILEGESS